MASQRKQSSANPDFVAASDLVPEVHGRRTGRRPALVFAAYVLLILLLILGGILSYKAVRGSVDSEHWVAHTREVVHQLDGLLLDVSRAESSRRAFALTKDEKILAGFESGLKDVPDDLARLRKLTVDNPRQQQMLDDLQPVVMKRMEALRRAVERTRRGENTTAETLAGADLNSAMTDSVQRMQSEEQRLLLEREATQRGAVRRAVVTIVAGDGILVIVAIVIGWLLRTSQRQLLRSNDRLETEKAVSEATVRSLPGIFVVLDDAQRLVRYNENLLHITGYTREQVETMSALDFIAAEDRETAAQAIAEVFARGEGRVEARVQTRDSRHIPFSFTGRRITFGERPAMAVVGLDITERKLMQQTLEKVVAERTAQLQETVHDLEAFSYSIAHDMRAPLRAMQGFAGALADDYGTQLPPPGVEYLDRIRRSAMRLDELIRDILDYSKVVRGDMRLAPVDPESLLRQVVESYPNLHQPGVEIQIQGPMPLVQANPAGLTQVASNLLGNAVKFCKPGEPVRVRVWAENGAERAGMVRLWFEDNGIGIAPAAQKRIFKMFERLNRAEMYEGTGIGLAIVRKAAERMGGVAGVESAPGQGSRFWVELAKA